ncbi:hypothetical protein GCM10022243_51110 [Saccharothrix violaceirubra]|uniref:Uncharacterized protein n=1 Tax=Saccharothrix violaceirubra TaxID=413306 RepID=A0A7W7SXC9_9PSEU|nr:hypothetical protein [Saccharothrix violaceirubra]MBB4962676.1 hypothetical protein [Saccharothrix violaceirubra]
MTAKKHLRPDDARELALLSGVDGSADLSEVSLLVAWAKVARLVRAFKGRLVPVKSAVGLVDQMDGLRERMWERDLPAVLAAPEALGAVEPADPTHVRATPPGLWGARRMLRAEGFDVPSP